MPVDAMTALLADARAAFAHRDWVGARDAFRAAQAHGALAPDDVFALGDAVWWLGSFREAEGCYEVAYRGYLAERRPPQAAKTALGLAVLLFMRGEAAAGSGWMSRATRLLADLPEGAEHGYALFLDLEAAIGAGELDAAIATALRMQEIGRRFDDPSLTALGIAGQGRALIRKGEPDTGIALLDEAMLAALSDTLAPEWSGNIYCQLIQACHELSDLRRAGEWTQATARWCETMPAAGPFMGICRVHRAQVLQVHGAWERSEREAARACEDLAGFDLAAVAEGHYQVGEVRRLRGDLDGAERAYREAHALGRDPQPGLALLRLAQGRLEDATATIRTALAMSTGDRLARARLCAAQVEIAVAAGDLETAQAASRELDETAAAWRSSGLEAAAPHARGAVLLALGQPEEALRALRLACRRWQHLAAPYEAARVRVLMARALMLMGNPDAAALEQDAAEAAFTRLGATLDAARITALRESPPLPGGLTEREAEVIALVAVGKTNREIGESLYISQKTVARHLSNIFAKLGLASRTAVAAYAIEHGLAAPDRG